MTLHPLALLCRLRPHRDRVTDPVVTVTARVDGREEELTARRVVCARCGAFRFFEAYR